MVKLSYSKRGAATAQGFLEIEGLADAIKLLKTFDKTMNQEAREASQRIAQRESERITAAARRSSPQSALVASSVRVRRDRMPAIAVGGGKKVAVSGPRKSRPSAGDLFFGAEFGAMAYKQFRIHRGREGYWFWPTLRDDGPWMGQQWIGALQAIADEWGGG